MSDVVAMKPIPGLPAPLPQGERILWRGAPHWRTLAWRAFHVREAVAWFALVGAVRWTVDIAAGVAPLQGLKSEVFLLPIGLIACALLAGLAWLSARTTIYTVTDRRVVMRIGMALPITVNIPLARVADAFVRLDDSGAGDVGLAFSDGTRLAWFALWPHCRPWQVRAPQPMMRAIADGVQLANILSEALAGAARTDNAPAARTEVAKRRSATAIPTAAPDSLGAMT